MEPLHFSLFWNNLFDGSFSIIFAVFFQTFNWLCVGVSYSHFYISMAHFYFFLRLISLRAFWVISLELPSISLSLPSIISVLLFNLHTDLLILEANSQFSEIYLIYFNPVLFIVLSYFYYAFCSFFQLIKHFEQTFYYLSHYFIIFNYWDVSFLLCLLILLLMQFVFIVSSLPQRVFFFNNVLYIFLHRSPI